MSLSLVLTLVRRKKLTVKAIGVAATRLIAVPGFTSAHGMIVSIDALADPEWLSQLGGIVSIDALADPEWLSQLGGMEG